MKHKRSVIFMLLMAMLIISIATPVIAATKSPETLMNEGDLLVREGKLVNAIKRYQAALYLKPNDTRIMYQLGMAYYSHAVKEENPGMIELAQALWKRAASFHDDAHMMKSTLIDIVGRAESQRKILIRMKELEKQLHDNSYEIETGLEYVKLLREMGKLSQADEMYKKLAEINRNDSRPYTELADMSLELGRIGWAKAYYERALKRNPDDERARKGHDKVMTDLEALRVEGYEQMYKATH